MKVESLQTYKISVPLTKPFKTALRTVVTAQSVFVKITCDNGISGWGEAPPTLVITGDGSAGIESAINEVINPFLLKRNLLNYETIFQEMNMILKGNPSSKAAVDMAVYDCLAQHCGLPLYQLLGGFRDELETDFTVSVNGPEEMGDDACEYVKNGFDTLKIKVGKDDAGTDFARIKEIRNRVGSDIKIRLDANQGWKPKEAIKIIKKLEDSNLDIELVEQPVKAEDIEGLKQVTDHVDTMIMADESVFTPKQALQVINTRSADLINIKLMKAGGIYHAQQINTLAEAAGMECMVGSMIETHLGITAAAHFAAAKKNVTRYDFDAPLMLARNIVKGGISYAGRTISLPKLPGLGITGIDIQGGMSHDE